jgi:hypothetical protein
MSFIKHPKLFLGFILSFFISGCASDEYLIYINSFGKSNYTDKSYILVPASENYSGLEFDEYSKYIHNALLDKGFERSKNGASDANLVISVKFDVSDPVTRSVNVSMPQFGQTGISSSYTDGSLSPYGSFSGYTTHLPSYGITGYSSSVVSKTRYTHSLELSAMKITDWNSPDRNHKEIWKTIVSNSSGGDDLRILMPYLVEESKKYFGKSSGKKISVWVPKK